MVEKLNLMEFAPTVTHLGCWYYTFFKENKMISKGFLWTAYGINHNPLNGYKTLFALNREDAIKRFNNEYGNDSSILYLVPDTFNYWEID